jgi:CRISPR/Cas system-associated exonuclease Cas4 (RecB family)
VQDNVLWLDPPKTKLDVGRLLLDIYVGAEKRSKGICSRCSVGDKTLHFHASQAGHCARQSQYTAVYGDTRKRSGLDRFFLNDGLVHEQTIIDNLMSAGVSITDCNKEYEHLYKVETPVGPQEVLIVGHPDGIINGQAVLECKAVKSYAWKRIKAGNIANWYIAQCQMYMDHYRLNEAVLLVKNREASECLAIPIAYARETVEMIVTILAGVQHALKIGTIVNRPYEDNDNSECRFCTFAEQCWDLGGI